jgi:hypothetical protein
MKIRIAAIALLLTAAAACSRDLTGPGRARTLQGDTAFAADSTPAMDDGGTMMGSGSRSTP